MKGGRLFIRRRFPCPWFGGPLSYHNPPYPVELSTTDCGCTHQFADGVLQCPRHQLVLERDGEHDHLVFIAWFVFCHGRGPLLLVPRRMELVINFPLFRQFQRFALPALGRGRRSRPTGKMLRRRKMLGIAQTPTRQVHPRRSRAIILYKRNGSASKSILRSGKHASRTKQWRARYATPEVHHGFRTN